MNVLEELHIKLTEMLGVFHDFCMEHSLLYYAIGGTTLGAARHKGFIPWDDDVDVGMPRPDYERFIEIFNKYNTNKRYILESPYSETPFFLYPFAKLYDTETTLIEKTTHPLKRGIFIDVFPLDGAGNARDESIPLMKKIKRLLVLRSLRTISVSRERALYKNILLMSVHSVPSFIINDKNLIKRIDSICKTFDYTRSDYIGNLVGNAGFKEVVPKSYMGTPVQLDFENIKINCPEKTDSYLTHLYGDWRTPPPKEKQITHHSYYLDLTKSYLE